MTDPIVASLVTGATAVLSGFLGYSTARGQQLIERSRLNAELDRVRTERMHAELDRATSVRAERDARREALYLEYLRVLDEYIAMVLATDDFVSERYVSWWQGFQALDNQMDLFATAGVVAANNDVYATLDAITQSVRSVETLGIDVRTAFTRHRAAFEDARAKLVGAMRNEFGQLHPEPPD